MLLAEELGADWRTIRVRHASPGAEFPEMRTSGSSSVVDSWIPLRQAGAAARRDADRGGGGADGKCRRASAGRERKRRVHAGGRRIPSASFTSRRPPPSRSRRTRPWKDPAAYTLVGSRVRRYDGHAIVAGGAVYGLDVKVPGMKRAAVARSPVYGGRPKRWNAPAARAIPGVRDDHRDSDRNRGDRRRYLDRLPRAGCSPSNGRRGSHASDSTAGNWARLEEALKVWARTTRREGDAEAALASAPRRLEATYRYPFQAHATLEPMNCAAAVRCRGVRRSGVGTQAPQRSAEGRRATSRHPAREGPVERHAPRGRLRAPAHLRLRHRGGRASAKGGLSRPGSLDASRTTCATIFQPAALHVFSAGFDATGKPSAWIHRSSNFHLTMFEKFDRDNADMYDENPWGGFDLPYSIPALRVDFAPADAPVQTGAWRSVGYPSTVFARESFIDEIAHAVGRDPIDLRMDLIPSPGTVKLRTITLDNGDRLRRVIRLAAEKAGWGKPLPNSSAGRRWGRGIACNSYHRHDAVSPRSRKSPWEEGRRARASRGVRHRLRSRRQSPRHRRSGRERGALGPFSHAPWKDHVSRKAASSNRATTISPSCGWTECPSIESAHRPVGRPAARRRRAAGAADLRRRRQRGLRGDRRSHSRLPILSVPSTA